MRSGHRYWSFFSAAMSNFEEAAEFNGAELARMSAEAARYGVTPITVNLFRVKFRDVEKDRLAILSAISSRNLLNCTGWRWVR